MAGPKADVAEELERLLAGSPAARSAVRRLRRQAEAMEAADDGIAIIGSNADFLYANRAMARLFGEASAEGIVGRRWLDRLEPGERTRFEREVLPALSEAPAWRGETVLGRPDGTLLPVELALSPLESGLVCVARDVSERLRAREELERLFRAEQEARTLAEAARRDFAFLDEASRLLDASFDHLGTLPDIAAHCARHVADACFIDLLEEDRSLRRAACALPERLSAEHRASLSECHPLELSDDHAVAAALRTGQAQLAPELADPGALASCGDAAHRRAWEALRPVSLIVVPLATRHRLMGALTWAAVEGGRRFTRDTLALARDLARRVAFRLEEARMVRSLDQMHELKTKLLAVAGHDLRAPLQVSLVYTQLLLSGEAGPMTPEQEQFLLKILRVTHEQQRLVESLLDAAVIGRKRLSMARRPLELSRLVRECGEEGAEMARAARLDWSCSAEEGLEVAGDDVRLRQVVLNLVQNAVKFTPPGGRVELRLERSGTDARVCVRDTGRGIPREALSRVFESMYQVSADGAGGLGLGLAIAKEIVEAHGGRIWAESEGRGRGSSFLVRLPLLK